VDFSAAELPIFLFGGIIINVSVTGCEVLLKKYDAAFFDVDGTLIDSAPGILHTLKVTFSAMGTDVGGMDLTRYLGPPLRRTFGEHYCDPADIERAVGIYRAFYRETGRHECSLYPGVPEMLQALSRGGVLLYTATSKPVEVVAPMLRELGIADWFAGVGGASMDTQRDTKTAVIRWLLESPALSGRSVLMVGDRQDDLQGAADCGLPAAAVLYGYGSQAELQPFHPVLMAQDCRQLTHFILDGECT
jgi:phosphoglycolate phosphatase